jgi:hypothetical protein
MHVNFTIDVSDPEQTGGGLHQGSRVILRRLP